MLVTIGLLIFAFGYLFRLTGKEKKALTGAESLNIGKRAANKGETDMYEENKTQTQKWLNPEIDIFFKAYVTPYKEILRRINAFEGTRRLLKMLDSQGHCSSIAKKYPDSKTKIGKPDLEADEWMTRRQEAYEILSKNVSLCEHTLNVATFMIEKRKKESKDFIMEIGRLLFVSLGHDIGKIPSINCINRGEDHFIISHEILNEILPIDYPSRDEILAAVRNHHYPTATSSNALLKYLKTADHLARQQELKTYGYQIQNLKTDENRKAIPENVPDKNFPKYDPVDLTWLDVAQLLEQVGDRINVVKNGEYQAFSHSGIVYVFPVLLARLVCDLAVRAGYTHILAYSANRERMRDLMYAIRQVLDDHIPDDMVGPEFIGRRFQIITKEGRALNPGFYIPLKALSFKMNFSSEIEKRKKDSSVLQSIRFVNVYITSKSTV